MSLAVIYSDGASSGNPGASGIGFVVTFRGRDHEFSEHIGTATNNIAEYTAFIRALEEAHALGATEVEAYLDSELVVKQINGQYRVKNPGLKPLCAKAQTLLGRFKKRSVAHVPREENTRADALSKKGVCPPDSNEDCEAGESETLKLF